MGRLEVLLDSFSDENRLLNMRFLEFLTEGILRQVAEDLRGLPTEINQKLSDRIINAVDAYEFLDSDTFLLICRALGADAEIMKREIIRRTARGDLD